MAQALEGIKVVDFSWVLAGPALTRYLADFGAEVVLVESSGHPDIMRTSYPFRDDEPGLNRSTLWANFHSNKYGIALDLDTAEGIDVAKRLVSRADIVVENFIPGTMDRWGIGYGELAKVKPDLIMVSISLYGQTGPYARRGGWGSFAEGMSGFWNLIGWSDRGPSSYQSVIGDALVPFFGLNAVLAALDFRRRTGKGQQIDLSQLDVCSYLLAPLLQDYLVNGVEASRSSNRSPGSSPHGVFPCAGDDEWLAIAVMNDDEWQSFCAAIGAPEWRDDPRFRTFAARKSNEDELERLIDARTATWSADRLMYVLQKAGVPSGALRNGRTMNSDPQLQHREMFSWNEHPEIGQVSSFGTPFRLPLTPPTSRTAAPCLGEHTEWVCTQLLGMSSEEFIDLLNKGVFE